MGLPTTSDVGDILPAGWGISGLSAYKASPTASSGTAVTLNFNAGGTSALSDRPWRWVAVEVKPAP